MEINDLILDGLENLQRIIQRGIGGPRGIEMAATSRRPVDRTALFPNCPGRGHGNT